MIVYRLGFSNGKSYIGQTVRMLSVRLSQHAQAVAAGSLLPVHCAWRKHGKPTVEVLGEYLDQASLHAAEIAAIARYGTVSPSGYNVSLGGDTAPSKNPEVAAKIAAKAKGRGHTEETRAKMSAGIAERWNDAAYREKVVTGNIKSWTDERRAAVSARSNKLWDNRRSSGWTMPDTQRKKIAASKVDLSDETRLKMSQAAKARVRQPRSEETKARIAAATKASWQSEELKARRGAAIREGHRRRKEAKLNSVEGI